MSLSLPTGPDFHSLGTLIFSCSGWKSVKLQNQGVAMESRQRGNNETQESQQTKSNKSDMFHLTQLILLATHTQKDSPALQKWNSKTPPKPSASSLLFFLIFFCCCFFFCCFCFWFCSSCSLRSCFRRPFSGKILNKVWQGPFLTLVSE